MRENELQRMVEGAFGVPFLRALTERLAAVYEEAYEEIRLHFDPPELHDLLPHLRRAMFERDIRLLAARFGLTGIAHRNLRKTSFYSRVTADRLVLTASAVATPSTVVRHAEFRQTLARDAQMSLLPDSSGDVGTAYYTLYIHGPLQTPQGHSLPKLGFANIVLPDRYLTKYIGRLDLLSAYAPQRSPVNIPVEEIERATITILQQIREENA